MEEAGWDSDTRSRTFLFLGKVREANLGPDDPELRLPIYGKLSRSYARNLQAEPKVAELSAVRASRADHTRLSAEELIALVAPPCRELLSRWGRLKPKLRTSTKERGVSALDRLLAAAVRDGMGEALRTMHPIALLESTVDASRLTVQGDVYQGATTDDFEMELTGAAPARPQVPLLLFLLDQQAAAASARSPLSSRVTTSPFYTYSLRDDAIALWGMLEPVLSKILAGASSGERLAALRTRYQQVLDYIDERRAAAGVDVPCKLSDRLLELVTLPQLVCIGLPALGSYVRRLKERFELASTAAGSRGHAPTHASVRSARHRYWYWLERYVILAVITADPMRNKNHRFGSVGLNREVQIALEADRIVSVVTHFTGSGGENEAASLKREREPGKLGKERDRKWPWSLSIVAPDLLLEYLRGPRSANIEARRSALRAGATPEQLDSRLGDEGTRSAPVSATAYSLGEELRGIGPAEALFVGAARTHGTPQETDALFTAELNKRFGEALHWVCRHALAGC